MTKTVMSVKRLATLQRFEDTLRAVMGTLVKTALTELSKHLDKYMTNAMTAQHRFSSSLLIPVKSVEEESNLTPLEFSKAITNQFASLMEAWTRDAVDKILVMLRVSMCEAEDGPPTAEQRADTKQASMKLEALQVDRADKQSASGSSRQKKKKIEGRLDPSGNKQTDKHIYYRDAATHESKCGPPPEPDATSAEPISGLRSDVSREDVIQEDKEASTPTSRIRRKKTKGPFQCPSCGKSFALKCLMDRHYLTHSKPHLCPECGKRFARLQGLVAHSRRHTGEKLYKCSDCGTEFAYKYTFGRHMRQHSLQKLITHTCSLCENEFPGLLALQRHRCCALKSSFVCSLCPESFDCRQSLADHENLHSGDRDYVCEMCGETFLSSSSLATHRVTHTQKENCCEVLGLGCSDFSVLRTHLSKHTGEKLFCCEVCGKGCSHRSALKHHMLTHTGERPYICETCGKRCGHASALQNHMRVHTGKKPGQQPECNVCGKTFRRTVSLKYHMSVHTGVKPYACDQCDKKFSNPSNLRLHTTIHSGEKMYGCNICGRRFTQSSSLKLHRRIHTGERLYGCAACGQGFVYSSELKRHQRSHLAGGDEPKKNTAMI